MQLDILGASDLIPMKTKEGQQSTDPYCVVNVRPDMRYCFRSGRFRPNPRTEHISVPPRHMTKPYAPDFQQDITTLQIQGNNISYNRHTTASNTIQQRKIYV